MPNISDQFASELMANVPLVDDGRFALLFQGLTEFKPACFRCHYFDEQQSEAFRCAVIPLCPGVTLHADVNRYLRWKLGLLSDEVFLSKVHPMDDLSARLEALLSDRGSFIASIDPDEVVLWDAAERCHDWRHHVNKQLRILWPALSRETRMVILLMAVERADAEEWD